MERKLKAKNGKSCKNGGSVNKPFEFIITQDSTKDDLASQKLNYFTDFLQSNYKKKEISSYPKMEGGGNITEDPSLDSHLFAFHNTQYKNQEDKQEALGKLRTGLLSAFLRPTEYELKLPKGKDQYSIFEDYGKEGMGSPSLTNLELTGIEKSGLFGRNRKIDYKATGKHNPLEETIETKKTPSVPFTKSNLNTKELNTSHGQMDFFENLNKEYNKTYEIPTIDGGKFNVNSFDLENHNALLNQLSKIKLDNGGMMPGEIDPKTTHGQMDFIKNLNLELQNSKIKDPILEETDFFTEEGTLEFKRKNKLLQFLKEDSEASVDTSIGAMQLLANIGGLDERNQQENEIKERVSNVHRLFQPMTTSQGDYMVNTPGAGYSLQPNSYTRAGYNTKMAKEGLEIDSELELSESEIEDLIKKGYKIEYLD